MFQGKVEIYQNVNWKEKTFTKNFYNYEDYAKFLESNKWLFDDFSFWLDDVFSFNFRNIENILDRYFDSRLMLWSWRSSKWNEDAFTKDIPVDLSYYEREALKLEEEKKQKEIKKINLEKAKETIKWYLEKFKNFDNKEKVNHLIEKANADLKKIEEELANLK